MSATIVDIPEDDYFAGPELSVSGAKVLLEAPAKYAHWLRTKSPSTRAMIVGSALHTTVLGTGKPFTVIEGDGRTKAVKDAKAAAEAEGAMVLTGDEGAQVERMADAIHTHPLAAAILSQGEAERSIYWIDEQTGVKCRCRVDWLRDNAIVDLKSAATASPDGFGKHAANFGYHIQAAAYQEAVRAATGDLLPFLFLAVEKDEPHLVGVHELPDEAMEAGRRLWRQALTTYAECTATDTWPDYGHTVITPTWPRWAA